jgi:hypothetical protein
MKNLESKTLGDNIYTSRFFVAGDKNSDKIGKHSISGEWWSRRYEYPWCANFVEKTDVCLDSACGVVHPFKYFLADTCKETHACDIDEDIQRLSYGNLIVKKSNILDLKEYKDNYFDKVYNISTLEHLEGGLEGRRIVHASCSKGIEAGWILYCNARLSET